MKEISDEKFKRILGMYKELDDLKKFKKDIEAEIEKQEVSSS